MEVEVQFVSVMKVKIRLIYGEGIYIIGKNYLSYGFMEVVVVLLKLMYLIQVEREVVVFLLQWMMY